jgi:hypothetical protein
MSAAYYDSMSDYAAEIARLQEYIELLENQVISMMAEDPIPFLPVDPEEQRRLDAKASDGTQCMIYRSNP